MGETSVGTFSAPFGPWLACETENGSKITLTNRIENLMCVYGMHAKHTETETAKRETERAETKTTRTIQ